MDSLSPQHTVDQATGAHLGWRGPAMAGDSDHVSASDRIDAFEDYSGEIPQSCLFETVPSTGAAGRHFGPDLPTADGGAQALSFAAIGDATAIASVLHRFRPVAGLALGLCFLTSALAFSLWVYWGLAVAAYRLISPGANLLTTLFR